MGTVPALSLRPSFWAPTALQRPHALHTDHHQSSGKAPHTVHSQGASISHGGDMLTEAPLP